MILKRASLFLLILILGVMVAACGDDDEDDPTATAPPAAEATATTATDTADEAEATETESEAEVTPTEDAVEPTEEATEEAATPTEDATVEATEEPTEAATEVPTEDPARETAIADATESVPTAVPTEDAVTTEEAALFDMSLTVEDLPEGWTHTRSAPVTQNESGVTFCNAEPYQSPDGRLAAVETEFEVTPNNGPFLLQNLTAYSEDVATEAMAHARNIVAECEGWTDEQDGTVYQLADLELPEFGDESFAMTMSFEVPGIGTVPTDFAFVRVGGVLISVGYISIDPEDPTDFAAIVERATEKVQASDWQP